MHGNFGLLGERFDFSGDFDRFETTEDAREDEVLRKVERELLLDESENLTFLFFSLVLGLDRSGDFAVLSNEKFIVGGLSDLEVELLLKDFLLSRPLSRSLYFSRSLG